MVEIRQATLADKPAIFKFLRKAYPENGKYKFPERWEWQFENNPFKTGDLIPVWVAVNKNGEVVGQIAVMIEPLKLFDTSSQTAAWAVDLNVLPDYRHQGIGFRLTKKLSSSNSNIMALPMSDAFRYYMKKLGSLDISDVAVFKKPVFYKSSDIFFALGHRINDKWWGKKFLSVFRFFRFDQFIAKSLNRIINFQSSRLKIETDSNIKLCQITSFDERIDALWSTISLNYDLLIIRTKEFLNWKYVNQPFMNYQKFLAIKNDTISGYIILRIAEPPESNTGIIADIFASPEDYETIRSLIIFAIRYFSDKKIRYIQAATSISSFQNVFYSLGFKSIKMMKPILLSDSQKDINKIKSAKWLLCRSDHDWDQYPLG